MNTDLLYLQQYKNGCRLIHCCDDRPQVALIDLNDMPHWGDIYRGRIVKLEQNYAWVDIGCHRPALLKRRSMLLHEGQYLTVRINREGIINRFENKGPQVVIENTYDQHAMNDGAGTHKTNVSTLLQRAPLSWELYIKNLKPSTTQKYFLFVDNPELFSLAKQVCQYNGLVVHLCQQGLPSTINFMWDELLDDAHVLSLGGYITIEETSVLTLIDVNTSALENGGQNFVINNDHERSHFNKIAAKKITKLIMHRHLMGTIIIDFLRHNNKKMDQQLCEFIKNLLSMNVQTKVLGYTSSGLMEITRPVYGLSLKAKSMILKL